MATVKYDVSEAEVRNFEVPKPGVYEAHIHEASHGDSSSGNPMFTIVFEITKGDNKGARIWHYILTDGSQDWRFREFTDALGLKPKGAIDPAKLVGTVVQLRTAIDPAKDSYDEKARVKNVLPAAGTSAEGEDDEGEDEPYEEWSQEDLAEEAEAREIKITGRATKKKLIAALEADDEEGGGEDDEEGEEEGEGEDEDEDSFSMEDLEEMSRAELKKLIAEEELEIKVLKKHSDDDIRTKIAEALEIEAEEEGDDDEDEEGEDKNYDEWEISELKAELKERGLKVDGRKSVLVARLTKDDASDEEPF